MFDEKVYKKHLICSFSFLTRGTEESESVDHLLLVATAVSNFAETGAVFIGFLPSLLYTVLPENPSLISPLNLKKIAFSSTAMYALSFLKSARNRTVARSLFLDIFEFTISNPKYSYSSDICKISLAHLN